MNESPVIYLPKGTEFVRTGEIPSYIGALYSREIDHRTLPIQMACKLWVANTGEHEIGSTSVIYAEEWASLVKIWSDLPELRFPISRGEWEAYEDKFNDVCRDQDWQLLTTHLDTQTDYIETSYSDEQKQQIHEAGVAESSHISELAKAISKGEVVQLTIAHVPLYRYFKYGFVPIKSLINYLKKLSIDIEFTEPHSANEKAPPNGISKNAVISAFGGMYYSDNRWAKNLGDQKIKWLLDCRSAPGVQGDRNSALWNPAKLALGLYNRRNQRPASKGLVLITKNKLNAIMCDLPDWTDEWRQLIESDGNFPN